MRLVKCKYLWLLVLCCVIFGKKGAAQATDSVQVTYAVLPDSGGSAARVSSDPLLLFREGDSLRPDAGLRQWVRIVINSQSAGLQPLRLSFQPNLDIQFYQSSTGLGAGQGIRRGMQAPGDREREKGTLLLQAAPTGLDTVWALVTLPAGQHGPVKPQIRVEPELARQEREAGYRIAWTAAMSVLSLLLILNTCVYFGFRDRAILHYLPVQFGAMAFVTATRQFGHYVLPAIPFSVQLHADGRLFWFNANGVLMHVGVFVMCFGIVQFSRRYLGLASILPRYDRWLRALLIAYGAELIVTMALNCAGIYVDKAALYIENALVLAIICVVLYAAGAAYRLNQRAAKTFLVASLLPVTLVLATALLNLTTGIHSKEMTLPYLAILSQAISFFLMILARIRQLIDELAAKRREAGLLAREIDTIEAHRAELELRHAQISEEIGALREQGSLMTLANQELAERLAEDFGGRRQLEEQLAANQRELASTSLQLFQKNELLNALRSEIDGLAKGAAAASADLRSVSSILQHDLYLDQDWNKFKMHFEQVHPSFFSELAARHPGLTRNEVRLYTYFHMNLSTKEIAALLNIEPGSVRRAKTRLYKKIGRNDLDALSAEEEEA
ncbi:MAG: hypothetical protein EOO08_11625 [Chitinophagaceae bacterium]|nr:MAG: hypothetical protein EOO08_11625 [Chitinophagaceae bacterium]